MTAEYIYKCALATVKVYGTRDAEKIFTMRGAEIKKEGLPGISGIISINDGVLTVYPPESTFKNMRKVCMAHMLGHLILHREELCGGVCFEDSFFIKNGSHFEKEADIFASEMLITDEEIKNLERLGFTEGQIACALGSLRILAGCKIYSMRCRGISVCGSAFCGDFMKKYDIEIVI